MPCLCSHPARRLFTGSLLGAGLGAVLPAAATVPECKRSPLNGLTSADRFEQAAAVQYRQLLKQAEQQRGLAPQDHPQLRRLRYIAERIIPFTVGCNERSREWRWEVNLIGSSSINAFCMPGGKIAFFFGILSKLQLDDDEVAMIMGHEAAHALLEHAREQTAKSNLTTGGLRLGAALLGLGQLGDLTAQGFGQLASLKFSRDDETEADRLGLIMAARAGYDPRKGVTLWQKMMGNQGGSPPALLSTHPTGPKRIQDIQGKLPQVVPMYRSAARPDRQFGPPPRQS